MSVLNQALLPEEESAFLFEEGITRYSYSVSLFLVDAEKGTPSSQIILIAKFEGKNLVAFPHEVWNRTLTKRILESQSFAKPTLVEVQAAEVGDLDTPAADQYLKLWIGFLKEEYMEQVHTHLAEFEADYFFATAGGEARLPFAEALVQVAQDHFAFFSAAEETAGGVGSGEEVDAGDRELLEDESGSGLSLRMATMEAALKDIKETIASLAPVPLTAASKQTRKSAQQKKSPKPKADAGRVTIDPVPKQIPSKVSAKDFPSLDASVVTAALNAGIPVASLKEMEKLMGVPSKAAKTRDLKTLKLDPLSEDEEDALNEPPPQEMLAESGLQDGSLPQDALSKLTAIVELLAEDKKRISNKSRLDSALDNLGGVAESSSSSSGGLKKAAAARRALRSTFNEHPKEIYMLIEKLMAEDITSQTLAPGVEQHSVCARSWIEHRSRIGNFKTTAHAAWGAAGILDSLMSGDVAKARARCCLLILQLDQCSIDRGSWTLASELSLEGHPPFGTLATHQLPIVSDGEQPFSKLLDGRWAEVCLAHLKDTDDYLLRRRTVGQPNKNKDAENSGAQGSEQDPKRRPKPRPKAKQVASSNNAAPQAEN